MNTVDFLKRVVPPDAHIVISVGPSPNSDPAHLAWPDGRPLEFYNAFFKPGSYKGAAYFAARENAKGHEVWYACSSFKIKGNRKLPNVSSVPGFWLDCDVDSPAQKKLPGECFPDTHAAVQWVEDFLAATGMPRYNLAVRSGYGLHFYWLLETPLDGVTWQPYGDAFKHALNTHQFPGDVGITGDACRVLRPPDTLNQKVAGQPQPVKVLSKATRPAIPNADMLASLRPFVGAMPARPVHTGMPGGATAAPGPPSPSSPSTASALAGGQPSSIWAGQTLPNHNAAAQANVPTTGARPRLLRRIADECLQVKSSLTNNGANDSRRTWLLGHLTLAEFCEDGAQWTHALSSGHQGYTPADTDAQVARIKTERAAKGMGPPSCSFYDSSNPGPCQLCSHNGKVKTPWNLGVAPAPLPTPNTLPFGYRRGTAFRAGLTVPVIEREFTNTKEDPPTQDWEVVVVGNIEDFILSEHPQGGYYFSFTYQRPNTTDRTVYADLQALAQDGRAIYALFQAQSVVIRNTELRFREFILAWVDQVINAGNVNKNPIQPFGWHIDRAGSYAGFALTGTLYKPDGSEVPAPGADRGILDMYAPRGDLAKWQRAFDFVTQGRPDLQAIIAPSFGAPLMRFTGQNGLAISAWSRDSGVGKTSALSIGQAVWSSQAAKNALDDTSNSVIGRMARTRALMCVWDEARPSSPDEIKAFVRMVFNLSQGKEKSRMNQDRSQAFVGEWETLFVAGANSPLMGFVVDETTGTDAGALRVFEFHITAPKHKPTAAANRTIGLVKDNYGHAGVVYAKWLAENTDQAQAMVGDTMDKLFIATGATASERFYIAGMTAMVVGAAIATRIGLAKFDLKGMTRFLMDTFHELRKARGADLAVSGAGYDLERYLSAYLSKHAANKLITDHFASPGPRGAGVVTRYPPSPNQGVAIQHAEDDCSMRIDRTHFTKWAGLNKLSGADMIKQMVQKWGAREGKLGLGLGTPFNVGRPLCIELDLTHPDLEPLQAVAPANVLAQQPVKAGKP